MEEHIFGLPPRSVGDRIDVVVDVLDSTASGCGIRLLPFGVECSLLGLGLPLGRVSVYGLEVFEIDPCLVLVPSADCWWRSAPDAKEPLAPFLLELCVGFGGMSIGASFLGAVPVVSVDFSPLSVRHLKANSHGQVLALDLNDPQASRIIHAACPLHGFTGTMGFPCQPYSSQGRMQGWNDSRAFVLLSGLRVFWFTQPQAVILECVAAARSNHDTRQAIAAFAKAMGFEILELTFDLGTQWPCKRLRWWTLLIPPRWNHHGLHPWPFLPSTPKIGQVLPQWGTWSEPDETELQLDMDELALYMDPRLGKEDRCLTLDSIAPTFLHSYSNATRPCPCNCRSAGFRFGTLLDQGLRGCWVPSQVHGNPRFLHPRELAAMLGVPDSVILPLGPRESNCLLGLIASPIQMVWIYGTLVENYQMATGSEEVLTALATLENYKRELIRQLHDGFPAFDTQPMHFQLWSNGACLEIMCNRASTAGSLLSAERIQLDWGHHGQISAEGGLPISDDSLLQAQGSYLLEGHGKQQARERPTGLLAIGIAHEQELIIECVEPGSFLFQVLRKHNLQHILFLRDDLGRVYGADFRLWRSLRLLTLPWLVSGWHTLVGRGPPTHGSDGTRLGLGDPIIWTTLQSVVRQRGLMAAGPVWVFSPKQANTLLRTSLPPVLEAGAIQGSAQVLCIFPADEHWALLHGIIQDGRIAWTYFDGLRDRLFEAASQLSQQLSALLGVSVTSFTSASHYTQQAEYTCGTIALLHACLALGFPGGFTEDNITRIHEHLLLHDRKADFIGYGPLGRADTLSELASLLSEHGVPAELSRDRATLVLEKLGTSLVQSALRSKMPWAALKAEASKPSFRLRLVTPLELSQHLQDREKTTFGASASSKKQRGAREKKLASKPIKVDPQALELFPDTFVDEDGNRVGAIDFQEVAADQSGIALCNAEGAAPFFSSSSPSSDALALALIDLPEEDITAAAKIQKCMIPAKYKATEEPVVFFGGLLQLGDVAVKRKASQSMPQPAVVTTTVLKIQAYRDLLGTSWEAVSRAPIRELADATPALQLCKDSKCTGKTTDCQKAHPAVDEQYDGVILDLWSRLFTTMEGKKTEAKEADCFSVLIRVPSSMVSQILQQQPVGFFFEPRCQTTKGPDPRYKVIWLPGLDHLAASHQAKTCSKTVCLMRIKQRFGVRVLAKDEETAFKALRPGVPFMDVEVKQIYNLMPLPHGTQKSAVSALLKEWNWSAKPLQPGKGNAGYMAWTIGAATPPPQAVMPGFKLDILITDRYDDLAKEIRQDIQQDLDSKLKQIGTANPDTDQRILQLESGLTEIQAQNKQFSQWFHDVHHTCHSTQASISELQQQAVHQKQEIQRLGQEVLTGQAKFQQLVQTAVHEVKSDFAKEMNGRFDTLEAMMAKKAKHEA
ncbi:unnamed protein product [Durusdinium trenchii]|uniref:DNA (cytosine-5-)-methyltransferase n=1 Tax=Durusdinium trenchii TaxID=1381693 RepID=A0ABP0KMQ8_9DINO